jgi:hypothetical protein
VSTNFPHLKTDAVAQYPARRTIAFRNQTVRFVDGREQRYRDSAGPLHRWEVLLERLDEGEVAKIADFFAANEGAFGDFEFIDPVDGRVYPHCSVAADELELGTVGEMCGETALVIVENRP